MKLDTAKVRKLCAEQLGSKPGERPSHGHGELAEIADISRTQLSRLLNGHSQPTVETLWALAGGLGVEPAELLLESEADQLRAKAKALGVEL